MEVHYMFTSCLPDPQLVQTWTEEVTTWENDMDSTPSLRHSTDASADGSGSVLRILGYLTSDIRIRKCGCAQISISRYLCMLAKIKNFHIFMGIGPFTPRFETHILHYKAYLNAMFNHHWVSQLQYRKIGQKCGVYFTYM